MVLQTPSSHKTISVMIITQTVEGAYETDIFQVCSSVYVRNISMTGITEVNKINLILSNCLMNQ